MAPGPFIEIGVPVWRGAAFVAEALESIRAQRDVRFRVLISLDGPDPASERACRVFLKDSRFGLSIQPRRMGWLQNSEFLRAAALQTGACYACVQPQDDLMQDGYLATLLEIAESDPQAAVVFSDLEGFGDRSLFFAQPSVTGSPLQRQIALLLHHHGAAAWRGLTRTSALRQVGPQSSRV